VDEPDAGDPGEAFDELEFYEREEAAALYEAAGSGGHSSS